MYVKVLRTSYVLTPTSSIQYPASSASLRPADVNAIVHFQIHAHAYVHTYLPAYLNAYLSAYLNA